MLIRNYITVRKANKNHYDYYNNSEIRKNEIYYENKFFISGRVNRLKTITPLPETDFIENIEYYLMEGEG